MNGGMNYPPGYAEYQYLSALLLNSFSRKIAVGLNHVVPEKKKAVALLVANARTRAALPVRHPNVVELLENGVDQSV